MSQSYIRIARTPDVDRVISDLRARYSLLSEAEIIKLALSEAHTRKLEKTMKNEQKLRKAYRHAMEEGRKIGDRMMREKGLDPKKVTEQQFYDLFLDSHKH